MTCDRYQDLRGDLPALTAHLRQCAECRTHFEVETELGRAFEALPQPRLPAGFEARLLERTRTAPALSRGSRAVLSAYALVLLVTTAAVLGRLPPIASGFGPVTLLGLLIAGALTVVPLLALAPLVRGVPSALWRSISASRTAPGVLSCVLAITVLPPAGAPPAVASIVTLEQEAEPEHQAAAERGRIPERGIAGAQETAVEGNRAIEPEDASATGQEAAALRRAIVEATTAGHEVAERVTGLAIAIGRGGAVVWEEGFGLASVELGVPVRADTRFHVWSAAKAWTVTAAARLLEAGRLDPNASVSSLVPEFPDHGAILTPMQLATHRAGIRHYRDDREAIDPGHCDEVSEAVAIFAGDPLLFAPGTDRRYSSWGYVLLGRVLERATGESFDALLRREVLEPLGMTSVVHADPGALIRSRAETYGRAAEGAPRRLALDASCKWGAGGYLSSAGDLVRFYLGISGGKLLSPPMAALVLGADADGSLRFGGSSEGGRSLVSGNVRDRVFVALAANERAEDVDFVEVANRILRALAQREDGASR